MIRTKTTTYTTAALWFPHGQKWYYEKWLDEAFCPGRRSNKPRLVSNCKQTVEALFVITFQSHKSLCANDRLWCHSKCGKNNAALITCYKTLHNPFSQHDSSCATWSMSSYPVQCVIMDNTSGSGGQYHLVCLHWCEDAKK